MRDTPSCGCLKCGTVAGFFATIACEAIRSLAMSEKSKCMYAYKQMDFWEDELRWAL